MTPLTPREAEVAALIPQGLRNRDIALRLGMSPKTVGVHAHNIRRKLGAVGQNNVALAAAIQKHLNLEPFTT